MTCVCVGVCIEETVEIVHTSRWSIFWINKIIFRLDDSAGIGATRDERRKLCGIDKLTFEFQENILWRQLWVHFACDYFDFIFFFVYNSRICDISPGGGTHNNNQKIKLINFFPPSIRCWHLILWVFFLVPFRVHLIVFGQFESLSCRFVTCWCLQKSWISFAAHTDSL